MKTFLFLSSVFLVLTGLSQVQHVQPGREIVGFLSLSRYDQSRPAVRQQAKKDRGRLLQINIWYPAADVTVNKNSFSDYVQLAGKELDESPNDETWKENGIDKYFEWPASLGADKEQFLDFLNRKSPMLAWKNAAFKKKDIPLVMLVHGFAADYAYLAEYLASHGYLVMHIPVKGSSSYELDYEGKGLETQVLDYEFGLNVMQNFFLFQPGNMAAIGFSFGGQSAVALSIRNKNIKAVVSLDGGIGSAFGGELLSRQLFYGLPGIRAAILHLYNPNDQYADLSWLNRYRFSDRIYVAMKNMQHGHFTSFGLLNKFIPGIMGKSNPDPGNAYEAIMLMSKEFLDQHLNSKKTKNSDLLLSLQLKKSWLKDCIVEIETIPVETS